MSQPSWRDVAEVLASRMAHHARVCEHPASEADLDSDCPFCRDRAAYLIYLAKKGSSRG